MPKNHFFSKFQNNKIFHHAFMFSLNLVNCSSVNRTIIYSSWGCPKRHPREGEPCQNKWILLVQSFKITRLFTMLPCFPLILYIVVPLIKLKFMTLKGALRGTQEEVTKSENQSLVQSLKTTGHPTMLLGFP